MSVTIYNNGYFEVVYQGIRLAPEEIVAAARDEDVDIVGISILSGSHLSLVPRVVSGLRDAGVDRHLGRGERGDRRRGARQRVEDGRLPAVGKADDADLEARHGTGRYRAGSSARAVVRTTDPSAAL